jgi:lysophospholipase L1-like esterase
MKYLASLLLIVSCSALLSAKEPITVYLAGDSTMAQKLPEKRPETGWVEFLQGFFDAEKVRVENHAKNGRSTRTFIEEKLWQGVLEKLKKGDYVFIQFGHNDSSKDKVKRYTSPDEYRTNLVRFISDVRARKAEPVLLTPVMRRRFDKHGNFYDTHGVYPDIVRAVAVENRVPLIDMHRLSERVIKECGVEGSKALFLHLKPNENANYPNGVTDNTHFTPLGAETMAALVVDELRTSRIDLAKRLLKSKAGTLRLPCMSSATVSTFFRQ